MASIASAETDTSKQFENVAIPTTKDREGNRIIPLSEGSSLDVRCLKVGLFAIFDKQSGDALVILLLLLSVTTGLVDAVSVLGLGKVFTANMTGNVVFIGFAIAGVPGFSWPLYLIALLCFALGAVFAGRIAARHSGSGHRQWLLRAAAAETALLWLAALVAVVAPTAGENGSVYPMIALTAAAMGARNATIRQLKVPDLTTTMLTLTITGLAAESTLGGGANPNLARRVLAVAAILAGAGAGALLLTHFGPAAPLFIAGLTVAISTWLLVPSRTSAETGSIRAGRERQQRHRAGGEWLTGGRVRTHLAAAASMMVRPV